MAVVLNTHGRTTHYTTDGSEPTDQSPIYSQPIEIDSTTTIRARCESDSLGMSSNIVTGTYVLADHQMPVVSISVNPDDLYSFSNGIYANGPGYGTEIPHYGANFWKKWWKKAHVELFDGKDGFSEDCAVAIFGAFSRQSAKKSFKIKFTDDYGPDHIYYDFYNEGKAVKVKNFVLRSGSQDNNRAMVRDEFFTSLMKKNSPSLLVQAYRPAALYVNGWYYGLYYIREKIDKHFVARHLNVSNDSVSIIFAGSVVEEGSGQDYREILSFAQSHDLSNQENYQHIKDKVDLEGLIDYKLGQMYSINTDHGNVRYVRSTDAKSDKKWHVVFFDLDWTWLNLNTGAEPYLRTNCENPMQRQQNILISALLKNSEFRQLFLEHLSKHMHTTFSTANTTKVFDDLVASIKPEMPRNCERWPRLLPYSRWEKEVSNFRSHFQDRNKTLLNSLRRILAVTEEEEQKYFADLGY